VSDYAPKRFRAKKSRTLERAARSGLGLAASHQSFWRIVMMILQTVFVPNDLAIKFVYQFIHGGVQIGV
jgi:hypothetical protein